MDGELLHRVCAALFVGGICMLLSGSLTACCIGCSLMLLRYTGVAVNTAVGLKGHLLCAALGKH